MAEFRGKVVLDDEVREFCQELEKCNDSALRMIYEYFIDDLTYIVESTDEEIMRELSLRKILNIEYYADLLKQLGASVFSQLLIQDILDLGREAMIGFWESLYVLQADRPHPNLLAVLDEITRTGQTLMNQILLDQNGHSLTAKLLEIQKQHKQHLFEKTQKLMEHRAPGSNQDPKHFSISDHYLDLVLISSQHFRCRSQHEIIDTGGKHEYYLKKAQGSLERISPRRLFRWCHRSGCVPRRVMISGVPGVGKTTLMQKFVHDWVTGKLYQRFAFVFFFKFRELNKLNKVSLETMILQQYPYLESQLENILQNPENLLFIFDGLDESNHQMDFTSSQNCTNIQWPDNVIVIVVSLLRQSLLKGCSVLMTSRPTKLSLIDTDLFQRVSEIMGFFPKERQTYFENFFGNKELSEKAFHYVRENDTLYTFCYIPSYCWIICTVLSMCFKAQNTNNDRMLLLPKTVTQLFVSFFTNILANHSQDTQRARELLTSLGWMAEYGMMNHVLEFDRKYLGSFNVDTSSKLLSSFMVESDQPPDLTVSFLHLIIQEFLSALVHFIDYSPEKLKKSLQDSRSFEDGRAEIFLRFLCGLSDSSTRSLLKPYLGELSQQASMDVISWLSKCISLEDEPMEEYDEENESLNIKKRLSIFANFFESRNKAVMRNSLGSKVNLDFSKVHLTPVDCTVLAFVLDSCKDVQSLNLDSCFIQSEGLERLAPVLYPIQDLRLSNNDLKDSDVQLLYQIITHSQFGIQKLSLKNNSLTEKSCTLLACAISSIESSSKQVLQELDLSRNNLAGKHFCDLMTVLSSEMCRVTHLLLQQVKLTDEYAPLLVSLSINNNLTHLNLSLNYFTDASAGYIRDLILNSASLKEIRLDVNEFSKETEDNLKGLEARKPGLQVITQ
ncbi:NACHT, LRR and PYD domains-containing protein 6-like [Mixophyes fleayi]|uniref:NACHT, LRR and PYD domains-containing protein 6-like n=1 Tax=Mixophyes fleayi TaxID=3061075 RepID=UPI003F4D80B5